MTHPRHLADDQLWLSITAAARKAADKKPFGRKSSRPEVTFSLRSPERPGEDVAPPRGGRLNSSLSVEKKLEKRILRSKSAGVSLGKQGGADGAAALDEQHPPQEFELYSEAKMYDSMIHSKSAHTLESKRLGGGGGGDSRPTRRSRHSRGGGAAGREMMLRSRSVPRALPADPDDASEAGTYTIDMDNKEIMKARKSIDQIFNVPGKRLYMSKRAPVKTASASAFHAVEKTTVRDVRAVRSEHVDINANVRLRAENGSAKSPEDEDIFNVQQSPRQEVSHCSWSMFSLCVYTSNK